MAAREAYASTMVGSKRFDLTMHDVTVHSTRMDAGWVKVDGLTRQQALDLARDLLCMVEVEDGRDAGRY